MNSDNPELDWRVAQHEAGQTACACLKVVSTPIKLPNGKMLEHWCCKLCGACFVKKSYFDSELIKLSNKINIPYCGKCAERLWSTPQEPNRYQCRACGTEVFFR